MNLERKKFTHDGKIYEIRVEAFEEGYQAAVFQNEKRLCQNVKLSFELDADVAHYTGESGRDLLIRLLEDEVRRGNLGA